MFARKNSADMVLSHPKDIGNARLRPSSISQFSNGFYVAWCKFWRTAIYPSVLSILGWCSPIKILKRTIRSTIIFVTCKKTIWAWAYKYFQKQYMQWSHVLFSRCGMLHAYAQIPVTVDSWRPHFGNRGQRPLPFIESIPALAAPSPIRAHSTQIRYFVSLKSGNWFPIFNDVRIRHNERISLWLRPSGNSRCCSVNNLLRKLFVAIKKGIT
jgi:hypothetical protein